MPEQEIVPDTRITAAPVPEAALVRADALVTVVVAALPPPVVPPPWVAQPTRPVVLVGGGEVDGLGEGVGVGVGLGDGESVTEPVHAIPLRVKEVGTGLDPLQLPLKPIVATAPVGRSPL
ncbi:hypothetical protein [Acrocarpospora sp. B8E8]|uniref:hypothetical protein n=1 Tax=Acrocarpospora sp. B8E8 TaxID=3153572 RepID=UPI00325FB2B7